MKTQITDLGIPYLTRQTCPKTDKINIVNSIYTLHKGERSGSVVEHRDSRARGQGVPNLPPPCCVREQGTLLSKKY